MEPYREGAELALLIPKPTPPVCWRVKTGLTDFVTYHDPRCDPPGWFSRIFFGIRRGDVWECGKCKSTWRWTGLNESGWVTVEWHGRPEE